MGSAEQTKYVSRLKDARVLVIGGTSGIGFGVAEALVENGANVIVSSSSQDRVSKTISRLEQAYPSAKGRVQGFTCNLGSQETLESEVEKLFSEVAKDGKLDHVIHTAGDPLAIGKLEDFSLNDIIRVGMVRFFSPMIVAQQLRKHLKDGPASSYTLTSGGAPDRPTKNWSVIIPYLRGLEGMVRGFARDLAPIRVNVIAHGPVDTEMWDPMREAGTFENLKKTLEGKLATGSVGTVEDAAESYLYLMKDKSITGETIRTNGGYTLI